MRFAVVDHGVVINVAEADEAITDAWIASETASIGERFVGGEFLPAPVEIPVSITRRQALRALLEDNLLDTVEAYIEGIEEPKERRAAQIEFEAATWERSNPYIEAIGLAIGLSPEQIDGLFVLGATY